MASVRSNKAKVVLRPGERKALEALTTSPTEQLAQRARIVLACVAGKTNQEIAKTLSISASTAGKWRGAFLYGRVEALSRDLVLRAIEDRGRDQLRAWSAVLAEVAHDRGVLVEHGLAPDVISADAIARVIAGASDDLARRCTIVPLTGDTIDATGAARLFEAADAASDVDGFARELDEFGRDAVLPRPAEHLLALADAARSSRDRARQRDRAARTAATATATAVRRYRASDTFVVGDRISHPTFGTGAVIQADERIRVRFASGERTLVHAKPTTRETLDRGSK